MEIGVDLWKTCGKVSKISAQKAPPREGLLNDYFFLLVLSAMSRVFRQIMINIIPASYTRRIKIGPRIRLTRKYKKATPPRYPTIPRNEKE